MRGTPITIARALVLTASLAVGVGCGDDDAPAEVPLREPDPEPEVVDSVLDPNGALQEGEIEVAWLLLPHGVEEKYSQDNRHVYELDAPVQVALRYFGPRLITMDVRRPGRGASYRRASPRTGSTGAAPSSTSRSCPCPSGARASRSRSSSRSSSRGRRWSRSVRPGKTPDETSDGL